MEIETARARVLSSLRPLEAEHVPVAAGAGRHIARPITSLREVPPYRCAAMDGWAVPAGPARALRRGVTIWAGSAPGAALRDGEAARIFTGAPLPLGADAVVPQELAGEAEGMVQLPAVEPGAHVRAQGEDLREGSVALPAGTRLGPRQLGICVAMGVDALPVVRRPRVLVLSTGDEIVAGLVPDSNGTTVSTALSALGAEVEYAQCGDERAALRERLAPAIERCDAVVTIGGASVGERDNLERVLHDELGAQILVHGVAMKPGKPFLFAICAGKPVFGLPGSPSACLVAFEVFARPGLLALSGAGRIARRALPLPLAEPIDGRPGRARFLWAALDAEGKARPLGRDVAQLRGPAAADLLLHLPAGTGALAAGALVESWLLEDEG